MVLALRMLGAAPKATPFYRAPPLSASKWAPMTQSFLKRAFYSTDGKDDDNKGDDDSAKAAAAGAGGNDDDGSDKKDDKDPKETGGSDAAGDEESPAPTTPTTAFTGAALVPPSVPEHYPEVLALPIARKPLFPGYMKTVQVLDAKVAQSISRLKKRGQPYVGVFLTRDDRNEQDSIKDLSDVHKVGTFASVLQMQNFESGGATLLLMPHRRIRATHIVRTDPYVAVAVENLKIEPYKKNNSVIKALTQEIISTIKDIAKLNQFFREQLAQSQYLLANTNFFDDPAMLADFAASITSADSEEQQEVLESLVLEERLRKTLVLLKKELVNARVQYDITKEVEDRINRRQREAFLNDQLRSIKKELGLEKDDKEALISKFRELASQRHMPPAVRQVFDDEIRKLSLLESASSEFNVTRNYLEWLTAIPWGIRSHENLDIAKAARVLDEDHYGLKDVKERILEFIAVGRLRGTVEGKILCLVGPPGVGKTSIGKSIARTLDREFFRFSVGGLTDIAEIKGHRRTYVGAMPGKMVQCLKKTQKENPLVLIDEIDKIGKGYNGDPASALLEMLDPEQNSSFLDHYLDVPVDLSKVLFVCTANVTDTIPAPLLDRMEVIRLSGYIAEEKIQIAMNYLVPHALASSGLNKEDITLTREAIDVLNRNYCREAGVRNLQKHVDKIYRKVAFERVKHLPPLPAAPPSSQSAPSNATETPSHEAASVVAEPSPGESNSASTFQPVVITPENLKDYVGNPPFLTDRLYDKTPPGVIMGLAWTALGGTSLFIEAALRDRLDADSKAGLMVTGQMGDVMKESSSIAYTYAKAFVARYFPDNTFFKSASLHIHVPEGATPKDGPSAGITMTSSLISLALNVEAGENVAMTGEMSLTGRVLRIGGVKEKTIAAKRAGVKTIIFPRSNRADWDELDAEIREGLTAHFVEHYDEVFPIVFPHVPLPPPQPRPAPSVSLNAAATI